MNPKPRSARLNLQSEIDALPAEGGTVIIPPGTHRRAKVLRIDRPNVHLRGAGMDSTRIVFAHETSPAVVIEHDGCTIERVCIDHAGPVPAIQVSPGVTNALIREVAVETRAERVARP